MQVILIGSSTTNKSTIARQLCKQFPGWTRLDSDQEISRQYGSGIPDIYYHFSNKPAAEAEISRLENAFIKHLTTLTGNCIIAAGPDIPLRENFQAYINTVKPTVILLEKSVEEIYEGLISRRAALQRKEQHQRPEFGQWLWYDANLPKEEAMEQLKQEVERRMEVYERYASMRFHSKEFFGGKVPTSIELLF